jgi:hypothetical protein
MVQRLDKVAAAPEYELIRPGVRAEIDRAHERVARIATGQ